MRKAVVIEPAFVVATASVSHEPITSTYRWNSRAKRAREGREIHGYPPRATGCQCARRKAWPSPSRISSHARAAGADWVEQGKVIDAARQHPVNYTAHLPNYLCLDVAFHPTDYLVADTSVGSSVCLFHSSQEPS
jgi:hypothetical protein